MATKTKILADMVVIVIVGAACLVNSSTAARTIALEKDPSSVAEMQKTFFHPFFPPALAHRGSIGKVIPGFTGVQPGFPSGITAAGGSSSDTGALGSKAGDRSGSTSTSIEGAIPTIGGEDNNNTAGGTAGNGARYHELLS